MTTPLTSEVEASEAEGYGGARPKVKSRAQVTTVTPDAYHQETVAKKYDSHGRAKPEQQLEDRAALLRDEIFSVVPGTVNTQHGTASKNRRTRNGSDYGEDEVRFKNALMHGSDKASLDHQRAHMPHRLS